MDPQPTWYNLRLLGVLNSEMAISESLNQDVSHAAERRDGFATKGTVLDAQT